MKLFVEGGGDTNNLRVECREAFNTWLRGIGLKRFPRIVASGSRNDAFRDFKTALANGEEGMLLVDSEERVDQKYSEGEPETWLPWGHLKDRDNWDKPVGSADLNCHLMVCCMENWFLADPQALEQFFGQGFKANKMPAAAQPIEGVTKQAAMDGLKAASASCKTKVAYGKGKHSFKILKTINATLVIQSAPWAKRFADEMKKRFP